MDALLTEKKNRLKEKTRTPVQQNKETGLSDRQRKIERLDRDTRIDLVPIDLEKSQIQLSLRKVIELLQSQFPAEQMAAKPLRFFLGS